MANIITKFANHTSNYLTENLSCLSYSLEILANKSLLVASYYDLLVDLSESFGVWAALTVLFLSTLTSMVVVHQTLSASAEFAKSSFFSAKNSSSLNFTTYSSFTRFKSSLSLLFKFKA